MKLAVVGSREFEDYAWMEHCLRSCIRVEEIDVVISGGARGADSLAARFAAAHGLPLVVCSPDWKRHGKRAALIRNLEIVNRADMLVAFWDGVSHGTRDTIAKARLAGKRVVVFPHPPQFSPCQE